MDYIEILGIIVFLFYSFRHSLKKMSNVLIENSEKYFLLLFSSRNFIRTETLLICVRTIYYNIYISSFLFIFLNKRKPKVFDGNNKTELFISITRKF